VKPNGAISLFMNFISVFCFCCSHYGFQEM
jgi:hypothetical protein